MNLDLEGADYEVFASIDLERWQPDIVCIELATMDAREKGITEARLADHGYVHVANPPYSEVYVHRPGPTP
ncbi:MAG: FkbM family methyltransferase [Acidimicrobiia bacterium]|nr:FkbM family methyltransferase [Acidimicrobiia bacterium]